jgi:hypothetical protein
MCFISCHLLQHCTFVRPGTSAAIATQSLPPRVCTAPSSLPSSSSAHSPVHPGIQDILPSFTTLYFRSTRNQSGSCDQIIVTVILSCILQLDVFFFCPDTRPSVHSLVRCWDPRYCAICYNSVFACDPEPARQLQTNYWYREFAPHTSACRLRLLPIHPYTHSLGRYWDPRRPSICSNIVFRSTRNQRGNFIPPILTTVHLQYILQLAVFAFCRFSPTFIRPVDAEIQAIKPPVFTLIFRSTRDQRGNCDPIVATERLYCNLQLACLRLLSICPCVEPSGQG